MSKAVKVWVGPGIAVLVLIGLLLGYRAIGHGSKPAQGLTASKQPTVVSIKPADVERVTLRAGGKTLVLVRAPAKPAAGSAPASPSPDWRLGSAGGAKVQGSSVSDLLYALDPLSAQRAVKVAPKAAGLQPAAKTLAVTLRGGTRTVLEIGSASPVGGYYAQVRGKPAIYLIGGSLPGQIQATPGAWLPRKALPPPALPPAAATPKKK